MTTGPARKLVCLVLLVAFWPQLARAQALAPAGVITTITGQATVARLALPPLLASTKGTITPTNDVVGVFNGATLSSTTTQTLIQLMNTTVHARHQQGLPVLLTGSASASQITVNGSFSPTSGSGTVTLGTNGAHLKLSGTGAKVVIGP